MKRLICLLISAVFVFCFSGCKNEKEFVKSKSVEGFADLGQIPECEYVLGDNPEDIKADFQAAAKETQENYYFFDEEIENSVIDNGIYKIFYKTEKKAKGISYIVVFDAAYGFSIGSSSAEIKEAMGDAKCTEEELGENNAFFMKSSGEGKVLKYKFPKNIVMFIFDDDYLCATAIYTNDWE